MTITEAPPLGRRELNKRDKLRRIIAAAREIFHEKGYELTTTQQVAERAGIGAGTLFLYAASKEDLLIIAMVDDMSRVVAEAADQTDPLQPFTAQTQQFFAGVFNYHLQNQKLSEHLIREVSVLRNKDRAAYLRSLNIQKRLEEIVRRRQAAGELRPGLDAAMAATVTFSVYWDCLRGWVNGEMKAEDFLQALGDRLDVVVGGLQARS